MARYDTDSIGRERINYPGHILLKRAMKLHGGTIDDFAKDVLGRSRVSVWRWLRKLTPIPQAVQQRLRTYCADMKARKTNAD